MTVHKINWITDQLAVSHAPMSYEELESIKEQGISAIVNLCGEFCDLHEIESSYGFEVYYLPIADENAPPLEEMEKALAWLDEAIYLGKKVLVHCRFGIGRTGTFVTSYLLRRGFGLKLAGKRLKNFRSAPSSFTQWWLLRKYGKRSGKLTIREPSLEATHLVDLSPFFKAYEDIVTALEGAVHGISSTCGPIPRCGRETDACCGRYLHLQFIEATYLKYYLDKNLTHENRMAAIDRAVTASRVLLKKPPLEVGILIPSYDSPETLCEMSKKWCGETAYRCPLSVDGKCIAFSYRPIACRAYGIPLIYQGKHQNGIWKDLPENRQPVPFDLDHANRLLYEISGQLFHALNDTFLEGKSFLFPITQVVSGKFVGDYFSLLAGMGGKGSS
ncbi:protein-tyrosine phosphatase family protein [Desulforhabdus amnigena]|jgi:protein-tyrosine phosphatase|uniref:Protein phosphatase n=1 Tax=Desulforhabdus amnigena TaxID=40218 RepID=A0A9W6FX11_9BACT|nr:dual specificity protein phosphatase family protein [Desulforhabdus amnigena]NLJ27128.1 phosphatase [Deltaproteobacteria bacterium]GLI36399.1 protein phosphatase [Desulforhabdus amnigena]